MRISVVTVVRNNALQIGDAIESVLSQDYADLEYIVVDGASTDGTIERIKGYPRIHRWISEKDRGMYDALNKGIALASGELIGFLHSDDILSDSGAISRIAARFSASNADCVIGDVAFRNSAGRIYRHYSARGFRNWHFRLGMMPPHPGFYVRRELYERLGGYSTQWRIAGDFELLLRFLLKNGVSWAHLPSVIVTMRPGGLSTQGPGSNVLLNREILEICRMHGVTTNRFLVYSKYLWKIWQFLPGRSQIGARPEGRQMTT